MNFSSRTNWPSEENPLAQKLAELHSQNISVIDLTISNPTLCGFKYLDETLLKAFENPGNLSYNPDPHGLLNAREAVCGYYAKKNITLTPNQIFLTANTSEAYSFLFRLLANPRDSLFVPSPSYPLIDYLTELNDVEPIRYSLCSAADWAIDFKNLPRYLRDKMKVFLVVNPNNPTGSYIKSQEQNTINTFCKKENLAVISDEVFFDFSIAPKEPPKSFAANNEVLTFTLSGISKVLGLPQMKLSWIVVSGPEKERKEAIRRLEIISDTYLSASTPIQNALPVWLEKMPEIQNEIKQRIAENYRTLKEKITPESGLHLYPAEGGWSAVIRLPAGAGDESWAIELLEKKHTLVHPGYLFDFGDANYAVLSLMVKPSRMAFFSKSS